MAKTIIQTIGPLYGESVNGTVFGRPNGSVYVPATNTITISATSPTIGYDAVGKAITLSPLLRVVAEAQDLASMVAISVYSDSDCTVQVGTTAYKTAGIFNGIYGYISFSDTDPLTPGETYYIRAQLVNSGVPVATSNVITAVTA